MLKTYSELLQRRQDLAKRAAELTTDLHALFTAKGEYDQVYAFDFQPDEDDENLAAFHSRQTLTAFKDKVLLLDGITEVAESSRYCLLVRKGDLFSWGEIRSKLDDAYGAFVDPQILAAAEANKNDIPTGDIEPAVVQSGAEVD